MSHAPVARSIARSRRRRRSGGSVTIEMLVVLPVLLIVLSSVVQFGYYFARAEQLALAARNGALEASRTPALLAAGTVPSNIEDAVRHQLQSSNISTIAIIVEHNTIDGTEDVLRTDYVTNTCPEPTAALPTSAVRVTVCVPLTDLMPNLLSIFGFNIAGRDSRFTSTFGYDP